MNALKRLALWSLCLALLGMGSSFIWAQPATSADNPGVHLGWDNKPNHVEILTQPLSQTVVLGQSVTFGVEAVGKPAKLHYAWKKDGLVIGGDAPTLAIPAATPDQAGAYTVTVSNPTGSVTSAQAILTVNVPPVILSQPTSRTVPLGSQATFSVNASGSGLLGYQWRKGGTPISGATAPTLNLVTVSAADAGSFDVVVTNTLSGTVTSTTSVAAILWVNVPPVITTQPVSQTVDLGNGVTFNVAATSNNGGTLSYQWRKDGQPLAGATSTAFSIPAVTGQDAGTFDALVTNTFNGTTTSTTSLGATLTVHEPPSIVAQPQSQTVLPPDPVTFTVTAHSNHGGSLTYAWKKDGTVIPGAFSNTFTVPYTEFPTNTDAYSVAVSDGTFTVESNTVYAQASVPSPVYAGDPIPVPSRPLTVLSSFHVDPVQFPNGAFRLGYDESLKNPVWTAYLNFPVHQPYANSTADYTADPRLDAPQVGKNDYTGIYTGGAGVPNSYDRGHQVPRADVSYRYTPVAGDDATIMSNLVPQISQFNQQAWQRLEEAIGGTRGGTMDGLTSTKGRMWVYTGSVFPENHSWWNSTITPGLKIAIPTACYKIVISEPTPGHPKALAILMPNVWGLADADSTLTQYITSIAHIESITGLNFFPNLSSLAPDLDIPTWKATVDVRGWKVPFEQTAGPNVHVIQPSYGITVDAGTNVTFEGTATPNSTSSPDTTIASATWTFGDGSPTATGTITNHVFSTGGSFNVTFTAQDSLGNANVITRIITVKGANSAPTISDIADKSTTSGAPLTVTFTVADDTTSPGSLQVTATADNTTLLPGTLTVSDANGACSLTLSPAAGQTGSTLITVTVTDGDGATSSKAFTLTVSAAATTLTEGFDTATKTAYAAADVTLPSGTWNLNDALLGNLVGGDRWNGSKCIRMRNGAATMKFDFPTGAKTVSILHAKYGNDAAGTWGLFYSTDGGSTWTQTGNTINSTSTTLISAVFNLNVVGPVRFEIRKMDGSTTKRICFDDFQIAAN
jgi:DNA/RNA endonuclease G (NUC1)